MAEHQPAGAPVHVHQPSPFGRGEVSQPAVPGRGIQNAKVSGSVQGSQQQQVTGRGGQATDPRYEYRLQTPAEWQDCGRRPQRGALPAGERHRQLQQGQRVALCLG